MTTAHIVLPGIAAYISEVVRSLNSFRKRGPYDTVVQHAQLRVKRTYSRIDTELGNRARQHRGSVKRAKALAWRALGVVNIAERSGQENSCFVITMGRAWSVYRCIHTCYGSYSLCLWCTSLTAYPKFHSHGSREYPREIWKPPTGMRQRW